MKTKKQILAEIKRIRDVDLVISRDMGWDVLAKVAVGQMFILLWVLNDGG